MIFRRLSLAAFASALCLGAAGAAVAEDLPLSPEVQILLQRLDAAERRIGELEAEPRPKTSPKFEASGESEFPKARYRDVSSLAEGDDFKKQVDDIKGKVSKLEAKDKDIDAALKKVTVPGSSGATMKVTGRIHLDYLAHLQSEGEGNGAAATGINRYENGSDPEDRFLFRRIRLGVQGDIKDNMFYRIDLEFPNANNPEFRDVFFGFRDVPWFQTITIGNQKRLYSLDQWNSSHSNLFLERPFIADDFNADVRRLGITSFSVSDDESWTWSYGAFNAENIQNDGDYTGDTYQLELDARITNTWWYDEASDGRGYGHFGLSNAYVDADEGGSASHASVARFRARPEARTQSSWLDTGVLNDVDSYYLLGTEAVFNVGVLHLCAETTHVWTDRVAGDGNYFWGYYGQAGYFLTGEHVQWQRKVAMLGRVKPFENFWLVNNCNGETERGWGAWQVAARFSYGDLTDESVFGGIGSAGTLGLNWWWNENSRLQMNYIHGSIKGRDRSGAAGIQLGNDSYDMIQTRFMVFF